MKSFNSMQSNQISNRFHHQSPYQSRFQYPPLICNIQNPNITPALKSLINSSPTLKALSKSFLPSINISENLISPNEEENHTLLDTIFESNKPKMPPNINGIKPLKDTNLPKIRNAANSQQNSRSTSVSRSRNNVIISETSTLSPAPNMNVIVCSN